MATSRSSQVTLIRGGWLAAWDGRKHLIYRRGELVFQGDRIVYAGPEFSGTADVVIDRPEWFVCPGFINLHGHIGVETMASFVDITLEQRFGPSEEWIRSMPLNLEPSLTPEQQRQSAEFSLVQQLKCGATTVVDAAGSGTIWFLGNPPDDEIMLAETVGRIGSRAYLSLSYRSGRSYSGGDGTGGWIWDDNLGLAGLRQAVEFATEYRGMYDGRIQTLLTPHQADNCSPELLQETLRQARTHEILIQIHAGEYQAGRQYILERYGETQVGYLASQGFLGPDIILGHCVLVSGHPDVGGDPDRDLNLIAEAGSSVAHSPWVFARKGEGLYSLPKYLEHGINVGLACDMWPADIIQEMRSAWVMGKQTNKTPDRPTAMEVFTAATAGSADALGRPDLGRLEEGSKADIACIDLSGYHFGPVIDPIRSLITCGKGQDVDTVFVDGKMIVEHQRVLHADEEELKAAAPDILNRLLAVAAERDPLHRNPKAILTTDYFDPSSQ